MPKPPNRQQIQQLHGALSDAFNINDLQMMVKLQLGEDLETLVPMQARTRDQIAYDLVRVYAAREGGVGHLIDAAREANPTNKQLTAVAMELCTYDYAILPLPKDFGGGNIVHGDQVAGDKVITYQGLSIKEVNSLFAEWREAEKIPLWDGRTPYVGLNAFQESDAEFFFGRESLAADLLERVQSSNFVTISGPSGSGKSSVARAGLFHSLRSGQLERSDTWRLATMQPRGNPIEQLAVAMARLTQSPTTKSNFLENAVSDSETLHKQAELILSDDSRQRLVLLVDQFEEAFTQTKDESIRTAFIKLLTTAVQAKESRTIIVLALRSDFISHCTHFPELRMLMSKELQLVGAMEPSELAKAIAMPAIKVGTSIDPALVKTILDDMKGEPGALPLMSFALRDIFDAEKSEAGQPMDITLQEYFDRGGIESALERHANRVFDKFTPKQKKLAEGIFSKLVEIGAGLVDTRRTATFAELVPTGEEQNDVAAVISALAQEGVRLITASGISEADEICQAQNDTTITIAHEKLFDAWPWLRTLINENRDIISLQNQINTDASAWQAENDEGFLYRGGRLARVEEKLEVLHLNLDELSTDFINASIAWRDRQQEERERLQREREMAQEGRLAEALKARSRALLALAATAIAMVLVIAIGFFFYGEYQRSVPITQAQALIAESQQAVKELNGVKAIAALQEAHTLHPESIPDLESELTHIRRTVAISLTLHGEERLRAAQTSQDEELRDTNFISATLYFKRSFALEPPPDASVYVKISGATFQMGSPREQALASANEFPQHNVSIKEFWIHRTEVTKRQYKRCFHAGACTEPRDSLFHDERFQQDPVIGVTWFQANDYARWVGGRLPTEAEWEYVCRGSTGRVYSWGDDSPNVGRLNYKESQGASTVPVGSYPASANGLYDISGNVWEWTSSLYMDYPYSLDGGQEQPIARGPRSLRGGSYVDAFNSVRCASRGHYVPNDADNNIGFRIVVTL